jgi:hypothetical protein
MLTSLRWSWPALQSVSGDRGIVALALIAAAASLLGALALALWRIRFADDPVDYGFAALTLGLLAIGWLALILAEIGVFSLPALAAGVALAVSCPGLRRVRDAESHGERRSALVDSALRLG